MRLKPDSDLGHYNLANLLQQTGRFDEALREYHQTIARIDAALSLSKGLPELGTGSLTSLVLHYVYEAYKSCA